MSPSNNPAHHETVSLEALRSGHLDETQQRRLFEQMMLAWSEAAADAVAQERLFEVADHLSYRLLNEQRHAEAREVAQQALRAGRDAALLHTLALAEHALGESASAMTHLEQALQTLGEAENAAMRGDMLEQLSNMQHAQGQALRAIQSLERAAEQLRAANDMQSYIRCKIQLAKRTHELGDAPQSSEHWLDILAFARAPENAKAFSEYAARALLQLAELAREGENPVMEMSLRREALDVLAQAGMRSELSKTLFQIARSENQRETMWQAVWLMLSSTYDFEGLINAHAWLFMREDQKTDTDASLLAAAVWAAIESVPDEKLSLDIPRQARLKRLALSHLFTCARLQGVHETEIVAWMEHEKLRREDDVVQRMLKHIETMLGTSAWLFDKENIK